MKIFLTDENMLNYLLFFRHFDDDDDDEDSLKVFFISSLQRRLPGSSSVVKVKTKVSSQAAAGPSLEGLGSRSER